MPDESVDMSRLLKELQEIKQLLKEDLELDRRDLNLDEREMVADKEIAKEEKLIEESTRKIEQKTGVMTADLSGMRYVSLDIWRRMIWENCESRRSVQNERDITYTCALYGGPCRFEVCPKNISMRQKS